MKRLFFSLCAVLVLSASCKKDKDDDDGPLPMKDTPAGFRGLTAEVDGTTITAATNLKVTRRYRQDALLCQCELRPGHHADIDDGIFFNSSNVSNNDQRGKINVVVSDAHTFVGSFSATAESHTENRRQIINGQFGGTY